MVLVQLYPQTSLEYSGAVIVLALRNISHGIPWSLWAHTFDILGDIGH